MFVPQRGCRTGSFARCQKFLWGTDLPNPSCAGKTVNNTEQRMRLTRDKIGDARGRPKRQSSFLRHPNANFFAETGGTGTNSQKGKQPWGQDFFPGVTTLRNLSQGNAAHPTTVRSGVQLMAGFEVTIGDHEWPVLR
jgi:hypothetical protein